MNYKLLIIGLVFILIATGCAQPSAEIDEVAEVSPSLEQVREIKEDTASDTTPETGEEEQGEFSPTISSLENEMDILVRAGQAIGPDHYADLQDRLAALEGIITPEDQARLTEKLSKLAGPSSPEGPPPDEGPGPDPETEQDEQEIVLPEDYVPARPDPEYDNFTWTLPTGASPVRLSLPADIDNFLFGQHGGIGGFGLHAGGHIEGLDHVWIELKPGTPVESWADGLVTNISYNGPPGEGEYHISIDYGENLIGIHMEVETPYVEVGDRVSRGQEVGMGMSFNPNQSSGEMALIDTGRTDGVKVWGGGVYVSPFDYLEETDKTALVNAYKKLVIEPYVNSGVKVWGFEPYQPYLTNTIFLHDENRGRLTGVWYLTSSEWEIAYPNDQLTFIEADNPYFKGNVVLARDPGDVFGADWHINGTFEVDYSAGRLIITRNYGPAYYGIFEIDESGDRAVLTIEYREDSYPEAFTEKALTYQQRDF